MKDIRKVLKVQFGILMGGAAMSVYYAIATGQAAWWVAAGLFAGCAIIAGVLHWMTGWWGLDIG